MPTQGALKTMTSFVRLLHYEAISAIKMSVGQEAEDPQGDLFARFLQRLHRRDVDQGFTGLNIKIKVAGPLNPTAALQKATCCNGQLPLFPLCQTIDGITCGSLLFLFCVRHVVCHFL